MQFDPKKEVQDFGPYQLVIRPKAGGFYGILWETLEEGKPSVKRFECQASTREAVVEMIDRQIYDLQDDGLVITVPDAPSIDVVHRAFGFMWRHLNLSQQRMLQALYKAPNRTCTTHQLHEAAEYQGDGIGGVNLWLGNAGKMFALQVPRKGMLLNAEGKLVWTSWFSTWNEELKTWTMRDDVAEGMRRAGCVRP